nr:RusA family crossover junction endodeoxyribonuclease [uncultured Halomonas sp.]
MVELMLPFPPSTNTYYRAPSKGPLAGRHLMSAKGRAFRQQAVTAIVAQHRGEVTYARLSMHVTLYPPDRRKRDIDNHLKALADAVTHAGNIWVDDEQIDRLIVERGEIRKGGMCCVAIEALIE